MSGIKDSDNIDKIRQRLYERGKSPVFIKREELTPKEPKTRRSFGIPVPSLNQFKNVALPKSVPPVAPYTQSAATAPTLAPVPPAVESQQNLSENDSSMTTRKRRQSYRIKVLLAGVGFFVAALVVSSAFLIFGNNNISGENIAIAVTGPFTIGGGEVLPLQVGITNSNAVPIQSATLIVDYPPGTKTADESASDLFTERLSLETIGSGETINVPVRAVVFGEENQEKTVEVAIEYRVQGSNATFFKEAEPLRFKISSSPVVVSADALKKVSSGQETDVKITITSNAPSVLPEVLVKAEYPLGFDYTGAEPSPTSGQGMWLIKNLEPETTQTITVRGIIVGTETDEYAINFSVGVPNERDSQNLASVFATAQTLFEIEQPFLDLSLTVNGQTESEIAISPGNRTGVEVQLRNSTQDSLYDTKIVVTLGGNAFSVFNVFPQEGYYDSTAKTITWDVTTSKDLETLKPGENREYRFAIEPRDDIGRTPELTLKGKVTSRRVSNDQAAEILTGTSDRIVRVLTSPVILGEVGYNNGIFVDAGPVPPRVGIETKYTLSLMLQNGSNNITNAIVSTTLPPYVEWLDETAGAGDFTYNPTTSVLEWRIGSLQAGAATFGSFQIGFEPRVTQADTKPILMGEQRVQATDQFTGTVVRATNLAVTTQLSSEAGFGANSGLVQN